MDSDSLKKLVQDLVTPLGVAIDSITVSGTHRTVVAITSSEPDKLIGAGGETLRALNTIAKRLVEVKFGEESAAFIIDVNNYQESKLEGVRTAARTLAQRARLFKHDVDLEPMSAYERLVVHELFAEDPEIGTESAGEGKFRHIVLKYKTAN
ncbi:MAG TPA: R3H domain-containing nucleic acid-binding protein [Candidatus Paceibacterota bacterium]|nr:R3H domain-containing nucleic acid-binding protein [Candidatus Paceibacterota bacterium]